MTKRAVYLTAAGIVLVIGITVWVVYGILNRPAEGRIMPVVLGKTAAALPDQQLEGKYVRLVFPGGFRIAPADPAAVPQSLERYFITSLKGLTRANIAITILPGDAETTSAYRYRKSAPELYTEEVRQEGSERVIVMSKTTEYEKTAFLSHDNKSATISMTASEENTDNTAYFDALLKSFEWKR